MMSYVKMTSYDYTIDSKDRVKRICTQAMLALPAIQFLWDPVGHTLQILSEQDFNLQISSQKWLKSSSSLSSKIFSQQDSIESNMGIYTFGVYPQSSSILFSDFPCKRTI